MKKYVLSESLYGHTVMIKTYPKKLNFTKVQDH